MILDMTTSMLSGGDMRLLRNRGEDAPPGMLIDAEGLPTTKVDAYYGPPAGAILPLGFPQSGHKGYGLSVLVDILAGSLSGAGMTQEAPERTGNALFIAVLKVAAFLPLDEFYAEVAGFVEWVKSCPPVPGGGRGVAARRAEHTSDCRRGGAMDCTWMRKLGTR